MTDLNEAWRTVAGLVAQFQEHKSAYTSAGYSEAQARQDFIDKLLIALGWDVLHNSQSNPYKQEVKVERNLSIGASQRRADYAFFVAPNYRDARLFVEAKKPHGNIATPDNVFQVVRYGWNNQTPLAVLTSFEEFHVIDCRYRPDIDTTKACVIRSYNCAQFSDEETFAEIFHLFGRDAVADGALDRHAEDIPKRRGKAVQRGLFKGGYQAVDEAFLTELDEHRDSLARSLKLRNPALDGDMLTEITQRVLDRLVFLRFLEDRAIETRHSVATFGDKGSVWGDFVAASRRLDSIYNGIIFKKHQLIDSGRLVVDESVFGEICERLAHVNSPYDFNSIPIHILGSIYERFLGKVIVTTEKRARVEEKPEVRKAGGVYYTPASVVSYIVAETVGKAVAGKSPEQIAKMRFADIACGSGSFLLGIYECLLDYHREWYTTHPAQARPGIDTLELDDGTLRLTLKKKREILVKSVFGVDIDHQAAEVAQLSLYLKLLDEETTASARNYQLELHETLLPSLAGNVVSGNSLIGSQIAQGELFQDDDNELRRVNPLDFEIAFRDVIKAGGFDAVIGNPPYVNAWDFFESQPRVREYINTQGLYKTADRHWDLYVLFIERALQLLKSGGRLAFIIPYSYALQKYGMVSRSMLLNETIIESIADIRRVKVFADVPVITMIPVCRKSTPPKVHAINVVRPVDESVKPKDLLFAPHHKIRQAALAGGHETMLRLDLTPAAEAMLAKIKAGSTTVGELCYVNYGAQMSSKKKGEFGKEHVIRTQRANKHCRSMISGRELYRHRIEYQGRFVDWSFAPQMYGPRWEGFFETEKVMIRDLTGTHRIEAAYDANGFYCDHTVLCALRKCDVLADRPHPEEEAARSKQFSTRFLAGVIASKVVSTFFYLVLSGEGVRTGGGFHTYPETIRALPIPDLDPRNPAHLKLHRVIEDAVTALTTAYTKLREASTDRTRQLYERQVSAAEAAIDEALAQHYGLTSEDLEVIETALSTS